METKRCLAVLMICAFVLLILSGIAEARFYDQAKTFEMKGKVQSKVTLRTEDSEGFTFPETDAGDMVQHRNLAYIEVNKDFEEASGINMNLHLVGRFLYEGVYDYGPQEFKDVYEANEDEIDDLRKDADLWEAYVDVAEAGAFLRVGRQNVSWGETDIFQMLDRINPLDNTYGGAFEDLDDRRIPLWMARGSYNFGKVAGISSLTLEGFWNPGFADQKVAPLSPYGTPYAFPAPPSPLPTRVIEPDDDMEGSRYGLRLQGVFADNFNFSLAHYKTILDTPAARLVVDPGSPVGLTQELIYEDVHITGGSLSFFEPFTESIIRTEVAYFHNEPVFIPEINLSGTGEIPDKDMYRFMVAMDKPFWARFLNKKSMINLNFQYFGEYIDDFDDRQRLPAPTYPTGAFATQKEYEQKFTLVGYTLYRNGTVTPQVAVAYDPRGAWMYIPSVTLLHEPWRFALSYVGVSGEEDVSFGFNHDRDQVSFTLTLVF